MLEQVRIFVAACFYYSGLVKLVHLWKQRAKQRLIILNYHQAKGENLRQQMSFLSRYYRILDLETALEELYTERKGEKQTHDKRMPLVLTFDDGYHDNYTYGFKLARELQIPITIFLIPGYLDSGEHFWWLEGKRLVKRAQAVEVTVDGRLYHLGRSDERNRLVQIIDAHLRHSKSVMEREAFYKTICESLKIPTSVDVEEEDTLPLTWAEVHKLEESGLVSFGAHTMHHPILSCLADTEEVKHEVSECRSVLEQKLKRPVRTFAYPVGKNQHIGKAGLEAVKEAGYKWALTTIEGVNTPQSDPYLLNRLPGDVEQHWLIMSSELAGLLGIVSRIRKYYGRSFK